MNSKEISVWTKIIKEYQGFPHLWDKKNYHYTNKTMRKDSFLVLLEMYQELVEDATLYGFKTKLHNLRTCFTRELKKVQASKQTGTGADTEYVPTLWYFDLLMFLEESSEPRISSVCSVYVDETVDEFVKIEEDIESSECKRKRNNDYVSLNQSQEESLGAENQIVKNTAEKCEILAKAIAVQIQDVDSEQLTVLNKLISDAIFYAKYKKLTVNSYIVLGNSYSDD